MSRLLALLLCLVPFALAACGGDDDSGAKRTTTTEPAATATATQEGCEKVAAPKPKEEPNLDAPDAKLNASKRYTAKVSTSCGDFTIRLDVRRAPKTTASFVALAKDGFYDNLTFHRIVPGFVIQGGDPLGTGTGGPGYSVEEAPPEDLQYTKGIVAMAKGGAEPPGTSGSQFFVVTGEDAGLPPEYALVGKVSGGEEVVDRIGVVATKSNEQPVDPVVIKSIKIEETK